MFSPMHPRLLRILLLGCFLLVMSTTVICADVFVLNNGGRIEGKLLNPDQSPRESYHVQLATGGQLTLGADQVEQVLGKTAEEQRYEQLLPRMPDTADGHWKMAEWCRQQGLERQAQVHLREVLERDTGHESARRALGYGLVNGSWVKTDEWMREQGYVRHKGAWRLRQEIALEELQRKTELAEKDWQRQLKTWRSWLDGRRFEEAREEIRSIDDPLAAVALAEMLAAERHPAAKLIWIEVLGKLHSGTSTSALIDAALNDVNSEIRLHAVEQLQKHGRQTAVRAFVKALRSKDNQRVNRAAVALGRLDDSSALLPLIEALTTKHRFLITRGQPGGLGATFGRTGSGGQGISGFGVGGGPKLEEKSIMNRPVLDALISLSDGSNYQFDKARWKRWYNEQFTPRDINLRRSA